MGLLEKFRGTSPFKLVAQHTKKVHECVVLLRPLTKALLAGDYAGIEDLHHQMSKTEHEADDIKAQIRERLSEIYLLSVGRNELNRFIGVQDDVADSAEDYSVVLLLRKTEIPLEIKNDFLAFVEQVIKVSEHLLTVAEELSLLSESAFAGEEAKRVIQAIDQIGEEEWKADKLQRKLARHFYGMESHLDPVTLGFLDKYCCTLSAVANSAEKASKYLKQIISR
ncbi:MAG: TIGR00153 family protein [Actinobacteria bacterium]|nr:TIGR00153 family protein [Actinomycetota bacterium]